MEKLLQLIQAKGIKWDISQVEEFVKSQGYEGELNDEAIIKLTNAAIAKNAALTKSSSGKAATKKRKAPANTFDNGLTKLAKITGQEVDAMIEEVEVGAYTASRNAGERMYTAIAEIPQGAVNHFASLAESHEGDVEGFREIGRAIAGALQGFGSSDAA